MSISVFSSWCRSEWDRMGGLNTLYVFLAVFAAALVFRLMEYPAWRESIFMVGGEHLMSTHDAYAWLAGAQGTSRFAGEPLSDMLAFLHSATGLSLPFLGFWLPVFFAPLAALPLCWLAARMERPEAGLLAGLIPLGGLGFLIRSRLGYMDTDMLTLFFAAGAVAGFAVLMDDGLKSLPLPGHGAGDEDGRGIPSLFAKLCGAVGLGLFLNIYTYHYYSSAIPIVWSVWAICIVLALVLGRKDARMPLFLSLAVTLLVWRFGIVAAAPGAVLAAFVRYRPGILNKSGLGLWLALVLIVGFFLLSGANFIAVYIKLAMTYLRFGDAEQAVQGVQGLDLPSVMASIREAKSFDPLLVLGYMAGHWALFVPAFAAYVWAAWRRPALLAALPLLGLGLAGYRMGARFTMYGGPALGLGLGLAVCWLTARLGWSRLRSWLVQGVLFALFFAVFAYKASGLAPFPVLPPEYARTFMELEDKTPATAVLWQWWDYGYAAQFYSGRDTFADGARHSGDYVYPLSLVLSTDSPLQAAQVMKFAATDMARQVAAYKASGRRPYPPAKLEFYPYQPLKELAAMGGAKAREYIESLAREPRNWPTDVPEQYLVVSWDNLRFAKWITRFGTRDLLTGATAPGNITRATGEVRVDPRSGVMSTDKGAVPLTRLMVAGAGGRTAERVWARYDGVYGIMNRVTSQVYIVNRTIYDSMMVRMLLADPKEFEPYFELVVDNAPFARAYRLR